MRKERIDMETHLNNNCPLISIIVPVYKVEPYLRKCVDSILAQTYTNIEVILVDDGSPDGCPAICDEYKEKDPRVVVIHQANAGVSSARNAGLDVAKGEYIGFVDSDDWIEPDMYAVLINLLDSSGTDISIVSHCKDTEEMTGEIQKSDKAEIFHKNQAIRELLIGDKLKGYLVTKLFKKSLLYKGIFSEDITLCEDLLVTIKAFSKVDSVVYQQYTCYHYLDRNESALHTFSLSQLSLNKAYEYIFDIIKKESPENLKYAKSGRVFMNICTLILSADNDMLDRKTYDLFKTNITQCKIDYNVFKTLDKNIKIWYCLFICGRVPFILGRKVCRMIKHS